ncbi:hypothetical protein HMPREF0290_0594 [Corynebacterium efficiens YS-314]|nr:hypothetical protein HMPREF0290_0594 [Corynebacterium efficiens YS-314]
MKTPSFIFWWSLKADVLRHSRIPGKRSPHPGSVAREVKHRALAFPQIECIASIPFNVLFLNAPFGPRICFSRP